MAIRLLCDICSKEMSKNYAEKRLTQRVGIDDLKIRVEIICDMDYNNELCFDCMNRVVWKAIQMESRMVNR